MTADIVEFQGLRITELPGIVAQKGERVTDEGGNTVCYVAEDIVSAEKVRLESFERWTRPTPAEGGRFGPGFRAAPNSCPPAVQLCIEGKWRP